MAWLSPKSSALIQSSSSNHFAKINK